MYSQNVKSRMSFGESLTSVFNKYATFTGRARRSEYWWFYLFYYVACFVINLMSFALIYGGLPVDTNSYIVFQIFCLVFFIGLFLPTLAVGVRRLHDIGKSGWNLLWVVVPIIGPIILLVWHCRDSMVEANKYGESPKYIS